MEFQGGQDKLLKSKKTGVQVLKGSLGSGKTTVSIYKAVDLEKNYCIYDKDRVLLVSNSNDEISKVKKIYDDANLEMKDNFYSLFSLKNKKQVEFNTITELIDSYVKSYMRENKLRLIYLNLDKKIELLESIYKDFSSNNKFTKFMRNIDLSYLLEEIEWIKASYFTREEYLSVGRTGRGRAIRKLSKTRSLIYEIKDSYSYEIHRQGYMDSYDDVIFAINYSKKIIDKYTHIILDDCEKLTRAELIFIKNIKSEKYGSFILIINNQYSERKNSWIAKGRTINAVVGDTRGRNFVLRNKFNNTEKNILSFIDKYEYVDIGKGRVLNFEIDNGSNLNEIIIKDGDESIVDNNLINIPVYSDIAAGEPILMNEIEEGKFNIPRSFIGKNKDLFMLHVKGDSMIEKNINDGDFVIIKAQNSAYHNEIVAIDIEGSATLKTLNLNSSEPLLMPANSKYEPIKLKGKESNVLGKVLGILKNKTNI